MEGGGTAMSGLVTAMGTAFQSVQTDFFSILTTALPIALAIVGAGLAITLGVKYFKKISGKS